MKKEVLTFKKEIDISLTLDEQFVLLKNLIRKYPEVAQKILNNKKISCPFPFICDKFPCYDLTCNGDVCDNGYVYRMS